MNKKKDRYSAEATRSLFNEALESSALVADAEADRMDVLASEMRTQIAQLKKGTGERPIRRGWKWRMNEFLAAARASRRIAISIRAFKTPEEEG